MKVGTDKIRPAGLIFAVVINPKRTGKSSKNLALSPFLTLKTPAAEIVDKSLR
jgi:hypothetical protein